VLNSEAGGKISGRAERSRGGNLKGEKTWKIDKNRNGDQRVQEREGGEVLSPVLR